MTERLVSAACTSWKCLLWQNLKAVMLLFYLAAGPSLVQALPGETLSVTLLGVSPESSEAVAYKRLTAVVRAKPQPSAKLVQSSAEPPQNLLLLLQWQRCLSAASVDSCISVGSVGAKHRGQLQHRETECRLHSILMSKTRMQCHVSLRQHKEVRDMAAKGQLVKSLSAAQTGTVQRVI